MRRGDRPDVARGGADHPVRAGDPDDREAALAVGAAQGEVAAQEPRAARVAGQREGRGGLERGRDADHVERHARTSQGPGERHRPRPAAEHERRTPGGLGDRPRPDDDVGDDPGASLRSQDQLAEVRSGRRRRVGRQVERARRRLDVAAGEQRLDPPRPDRLLAGRARRDPAADRRELPRLRVVPEREPGRAEGRLDRRAGRRRRRTWRARSPRRGRSAWPSRRARP